MRTTFYEEITKNKLLSILLFSLLFIFLISLFYFIAEIYNPYFLPFFLLIGGIIVIIQALTSYYIGDKIVLKITGAKPAPKEKYLRLHNIVEGLCLAAGLPKPKIYTIPSENINAFATGRDPKHASIAVTEGAIKNLNKLELEGVIAHELSHIANYDILFQTIVAVVVGLISIIAHFFLRSFWFTGNRRDRGEIGIILIFVGILFAIIAPISASLVRLAISRKREFLADATGAKLTRYPEGLASALEKIAKMNKRKMDVSKAVAPLFIANPFKVTKIETLFSTHPPIEERIKRLRAM